jgi:hypothetical protein
MVHDTVETQVTKGKFKVGKFWVRRKADNAWLMRAYTIERAMKFAHFIAEVAGDIIITKGRVSDLDDIVFDLPQSLCINTSQIPNETVTEKEYCDGFCNFEEIMG